MIRLQAGWSDRDKRFIQPSPGAHAVSYSGYTRDFFNGNKAAGRWCQPLTHLCLVTEVKNEWSYTSTPPMCLYGVDRDNNTFI
jgi:hypothetical protein